MKKILSIVSILISVSVSAHPMEERAFSDKNEIRGVVMPRVEALFSSKINGNLGLFILEPGQKFIKGQKILEFDCAEQNIKKMISLSRLDLAIKEKNKDVNKLSKDKKEILENKIKEEKLNTLLEDVYSNNCVIIAPFSGRLSNIKIRPYQSLKMGMPLFELYSDKNLKLKMNLPSELILSLKIGDTLSVNIDENNKQYFAVVSAIDHKIDYIRKTFEVEANFESTEDLVVGMSGVVQIKGLKNENK